MEEFFQDFDPLRHGSISVSQFRQCLNSLGQTTLTEAQFQVLAQQYADLKRPGNVMWTKFLTDVEIGKKCSIKWAVLVYLLTRRKIVCKLEKLVAESRLWIKFAMCSLFFIRVVFINPRNTLWRITLYHNFSHFGSSVFYCAFSTITHYYTLICTLCFTG